MAFQQDPDKIVWKLHLNSPPDKIYPYIATDKGRSSWWAESTVEKNGNILFLLKNNIQCESKIISFEPNRKFEVIYFGSKVSFLLESDNEGGCELTVHETPSTSTDRNESTAGWVSVLLALKAAADFGIDLRNHNEHQTWQHGFCDN